MALSVSVKRLLNMNRSEFKELVDKYFDDCEDNKKQPSLVGLAVHLEVGKQWLVDIKADKFKAFQGTFHKEIVIMAYEKIELYLVDRLFKDNDKKAISAMFVLKCNHNYQEKPSVDLSNITEIKINFQ